jgi:hypothetical protein
MSGYYQWIFKLVFPLLLNEWVLLMDFQASFSTFAERVGIINGFLKLVFPLLLNEGVLSMDFQASFFHFC